MALQVTHNFLVRCHQVSLSKIDELDSDVERDRNEVIEQQEEHETVRCGKIME
jgi:hypothetical protein